MSGPFDDSSNDAGKDFGYKGKRADALEQGDLRDITAVGLEVGFMWHAAMTAAVWDDCVAWSKEDSKRQLYQTERMRLVEVLRTAAFGIRVGDPDASRLEFIVARVPRNGRSKRISEVKLEIVAHFDDTGQRVLTILHPAAKTDS